MIATSRRGRRWLALRNKGGEYSPFYATTSPPVDGAGRERLAQSRSHRASGGRAWPARRTRTSDDESSTTCAGSPGRAAPEGARLFARIAGRMRLRRQGPAVTLRRGDRARVALCSLLCAELRESFSELLRCSLKAKPRAVRRSRSLLRGWVVQQTPLAGSVAANAPPGVSRTRMVAEASPRSRHASRPETRTLPPLCCPVLTAWSARRLGSIAVAIVSATLVARDRETRSTRLDARSTMERAKRRRPVIA